MPRSKKDMTGKLCAQECGHLRCVMRKGHTGSHVDGFVYWNDTLPDGSRDHERHYDDPPKARVRRDRWNDKETLVRTRKALDYDTYDAIREKLADGYNVSHAHPADDMEIEKSGTFIAICLGDQYNSARIIGPFDTKEDARTWTCMERNTVGNYAIHEIKTPTFWVENEVVPRERGDR